ncbi:MAG: glycosyltransferase family 1 protein [Oscillospiraceae bacterium]|nr:glycosyltransferase family 1 protein [Oscillospiraceae bacterium]
MKIAFDALPLISERMTGIGYCQAGQIQALMALHPENRYVMQFFAAGDGGEKRKRLQSYEDNRAEIRQGKCSGYLYRLVSNFLPVPYNYFFGKDADITHFFNYIVPPKVSGKTVVTVHDMVYKTFPETVRGRTRYMLETGLKRSMKRADLIVTDSEFSRTEIVKYFPQWENKLRVVPCGVDRARFHPVENAAAIDETKKLLGIEREYFLYLGTLEPRKNLRRLAVAYNDFRRGKSEYPCLVLAGGKGWLNDELMAAIKELHLETDVKLVSYVPEEHICTLMSGALAFVFPSIYEGFGMPPLEAMACGVPVLTTHAASLPEVVGDCAMICDPYHPEQMTDCLERLYRESKLRRQLSEAGLKRARMFSWENAAAVLYDVYKEALGG